MLYRSFRSVLHRSIPFIKSGKPSPRVDGENNKGKKFSRAGSSLCEIQIKRLKLVPFHPAASGVKTSSVYLNPAKHKKKSVVDDPTASEKNFPHFLCYFGTEKHPMLVTSE